MGDPTDKPKYAFTPGPPPEVSAFFRNKTARPSFSFEDVEPAEHAVQFTVAKAMNLDVLEAIQQALQEAIDEGIPYAQFSKDLKPRLQKMGWWGIDEQVDPLTGKVRKVQLGSPRRLKTIYRANIQSARAAGQWDRIQRTKRALPYLVYLLGPSEQHRPLHAVKAGMVLPVDDPFWQTWYPPNGWGCKCHVRQITKREADEIGVSDSPEIPMRDVFNKRTGEMKRIPSGIDPGWESNPGLYRQKQMERFLAGKLDGSDPVIARTAARDMASSWRAQRIHDGSAKGAVPIAMLTDTLAKAIGAKTRVVQYSDYTAEKSRNKHAEVTSQKLHIVSDLIENGEVRTRDDQHLILIGAGDLPWIAVVKRTVDGSENYLSTMYQIKSGRYLARLRNSSRIVK